MAVICSILQLSEIQNKEINKNESQSCSFQHSLNIWDYHWGGGGRINRQASRKNTLVDQTISGLGALEQS